MAASAGFQRTSVLRKQIAEGQDAFTSADKEHRDALFQARSRDEALKVLEALPAEPPVTAENLKPTLEGILKGETVKKEGRVNVPGLKLLLKKIEEGKDATPDSLREEVAAEVAAHTDEIARLAAEVDKQKRALDALIAEYKGYQDLVPRGAVPVLAKALGEKAEQVRVADFRRKEEETFLAPFEKDRRGATPRQIEQDLVDLRKKLEAFPEGPIADVAKCTARDQLKSHVENLQAEVDHIAHKAKCHRCPPESPAKGIERDAAAKKLIFDKIKELEEYASGARKPGNEAEFADQQLALALHSMMNDADENGKVSGKMLGVLVCKTPSGEPVLLYGYSGTLGPNSRIAEREKFFIDLQIDPAGKLEANRLKQADAQAKIDLAAAELERTAAAKEVSDARRRRAALEQTEKKLRQLLAPPKKKAPPKKSGAAVAESKPEPAEPEPPIDKGAIESALQENAEKMKVEEELIAAAEEKLNASVEAKRLQVAKQDKLALEAHAKRLADEKRKQEAELAVPPELKDNEAAAREHVEKKKAEAAKKQEDLKVQLAEAETKIKAASKLDDQLESSTGSRWVRSIPEDGKLVSAGGDTVSLALLNTDHFDTPHGVCSAPKMIQTARAQKLEIVSMAEAWFGHGPNQHRELVASCNTCMKNIGFQCCEVKKHA
jgi:hypothetical protein